MNKEQVLNLEWRWNQNQKSPYNNKKINWILGKNVNLLTIFNFLFKFWFKQLTDDVDDYVTITSKELYQELCNFYQSANLIKRFGDFLSNLYLLKFLKLVQFSKDGFRINIEYVHKIDSYSKENEKEVIDTYRKLIEECSKPWYYCYSLLIAEKENMEDFLTFINNETYQDDVITEDTIKRYILGDTKTNPLDQLERVSELYHTAVLPYLQKKLEKKHKTPIEEKYKDKHLGDISSLITRLRENVHNHQVWNLKKFKKLDNYRLSKQGFLQGLDELELQLTELMDKGEEAVAIDLYDRTVDKVYDIIEKLNSKYSDDYSPTDVIFGR